MSLIINKEYPILIEYLNIKLHTDFVGGLPYLLNKNCLLNIKYLFPPPFIKILQPTLNMLSCQLIRKRSNKPRLFFASSSVVMNNARLWIIYHLISGRHTSRLMLQVSKLFNATLSPNFYRQVF